MDKYSFSEQLIYYRPKNDTSQKQNTKTEQLTYYGTVLIKTEQYIFNEKNIKHNV